MNSRLIGSLTEIYTNEGGGNFLTQSYPTFHHEFYTSKILSKGEDISDYMEVTPQRKASLEKHDAGFVEPGAEFIDDVRVASTLFKYNKSTGYFEIELIIDGVDYGMKDLTVEEVRKALVHHYHGGNLCGMAYYVDRVTFPPSGYHNMDITDAQLICTNQHKIELLLLRRPGSYLNCATTTILRSIRDCSNLRAVAGILNMANVDGLSLTGLPKLESFHIQITGNHNTPAKITFKDSPLIRLESLQFLVDKAKAQSKGLTVTVHPEVFAKLNDEGNAEWYKVLTDGAEKNIIFATT